jgi:hypothetical protein
MKILEIEIQTDNINETENFYTDILGFQLTSKSDGLITFKIGNSILRFIKSDNIKPRYHFAFNIPANKLEEAINWTKSKVKLIENEEKITVESDNGVDIEINKKIYVKIPFKNKDAVKKLGCRWEPEKKSWYYMSNLEKNKIDSIKKLEA